MDPTQQPQPSTSPATSPKNVLHAYIAKNSVTLLRIIMFYVQRLGWASGQPARDAANEILNEMTAQALANADEFDTSRQPRAWLLGIAVKLIQHRRRTMGRQEAHEEYAQAAHDGDDEGEVDIFDQCAKRAWQQDEVDQANERLSNLLALATPADRELLTRIDLHGWNYAALAQQMGVTEMALRKRHHRAIQRLRQLASQKGGQRS